MKYEIAKLRIVFGKKQSVAMKCKMTCKNNKNKISDNRKMKEEKTNSCKRRKGLSFPIFIW